MPNSTKLCQPMKSIKSVRSSPDKAAQSEKKVGYQEQSLSAIDVTEFPILGLSVQILYTCRRVLHTTGWEAHDPSVYAVESQFASCSRPNWDAIGAAAAMMIVASALEMNSPVCDISGFRQQNQGVHSRTEQKHCDNAANVGQFLTCVARTKQRIFFIIACRM